MKRRIILLLVLSVICVGGCKSKKKAEDNPIIKTDKVYYRQEETINIIVSNELKKEMTFYPWLGWDSVFIEKKNVSGNSWEPLLVSKRMNVKIDSFMMYFQPKERKYFDWDQTILVKNHRSWRVFTGKGRYRIKFIYWTDCHYTTLQKSCEKHSIYSNEFVIK
ncbi:MAG: hypothetical protein PHE88_09895 [Elusimicrobia bacterium]|nr:hypothetical protein [Elusimicrobiota bacterium]